MYTIAGCFLKKKIALLEADECKSEIHSINVQNLLIVMTLFLLDLDQWFKLFNTSEFVLQIAENGIYCIASSFITNYLFIVHHRVFKATKAKLNTTQIEQFSESE